MELAFRHWGAAEGAASDGKAITKPKLLFLHGMGGTGSLWRPIAAQLEDQCEILAPDQRGHGGSRVSDPSQTPVKPDFTPEAYAHDVVETLQKLNFFPCWVVGHSMGARTACALASLKPKWVRGLVIVDLGLDGLAGGGLGENLASFIRILPSHFASRTEAREFMEKHCPDRSMGQYLMAVSAPLPEERGGGIGFPFDPAALLSTIDAARGVSLRPWIREAAQNRIPVLALRGAQSGVWSKSDYERDQQELARLPGVQFEEVEGAGHGLPFEQRALFVERLKKLAGLSGV